MTDGAAGPHGPWSVLRIPAMRRILPAYGVSKTGDLLYAMSLIAVVLERTGSAGWVSAAVVAHMAPNALVTPFAGVLADRMDRIRLMVLSDVVRLVLMVVAAVLVAVEAPVALLVAVAFLVTSAGTPFSSALVAALPDHVEEDRLPAANAAIQALMNVGYLVGPVLATVLLRAGSDWLPFALNALTFVLSIAMFTGLRRAAATARAGAGGAGTDGGTDGGTGGSGDPAPDGPQESFGQAFTAGVRRVLADRFLVIVAVVIVPVSFAWGANHVLLPLVGDELLGTGAEGIGLLTAATGLGGVLGAGLAARLAGGDRLLAMLSFTCLVSVVPMGLLALVGEPLVAYAVLVVEGVAVVALEVVWITALQRILPLDQLARVDALFTSISFGVGVLGNVGAPALVDAVGLRGALVTTLVVGAAGAVAGLVWGGGVRLTRRDGDLVAALRGVGALDGLDEAGYEALAGAASAARTVPAGTTLLVAGTPADEVLVLVSGSADVLATTRDGVPLAEPVLVNRVSGPDLLGEIGVLRRRPRTADVVTTSEAVVRRVPAAAFEAVVSPATAPTALGVTVGARLGRWPG